MRNKNEKGMKERTKDDPQEMNSRTEQRRRRCTKQSGIPYHFIHRCHFLFFFRLLPSLLSFRLVQMGSTPLHLAVEQPAALQKLLEAKANLNALNKVSQCIQTRVCLILFFHFPADSVRGRMIRQWKDILLFCFSLPLLFVVLMIFVVCVALQEKQCVLSAAADKGNPEAIQILLKAGAKVNAKDKVCLLLSHFGA